MEFYSIFCSRLPLSSFTCSKKFQCIDICGPFQPSLVLSRLRISMNKVDMMRKYSSLPHGIKLQCRLCISNVMNREKEHMRMVLDMEFADVLGLHRQVLRKVRTPRAESSLLISWLCRFKLGTTGTSDSCCSRIVPLTGLSPVGFKPNRRASHGCLHGHKWTHLS